MTEAASKVSIPDVWKNESPINDTDSAGKLSCRQRGVRIFQIIIFSAWLHWTTTTL